MSDEQDKSEEQEQAQNGTTDVALSIPDPPTPDLSDVPAAFAAAGGDLAVSSHHVVGNPYSPLGGSRLTGPLTGPRPVNRWAIRKCKGGVALPREDFNKAAAREREAGTYYGQLTARDGTPTGEQGFGCLPSGAQTWLNRDVPDQMARRMDGVEVVDLNQLTEEELAQAQSRSRPSVLVDLSQGPARPAGAWRREAAGDLSGPAVPVATAPVVLPDHPEPALDLADAKRLAATLVRLMRTEKDPERLYARCRGLVARVRDAARSVGYHQGYADALQVVALSVAQAEHLQKNPSGEDARRRYAAEHLPDGWTLEELTGGS